MKRYTFFSIVTTFGENHAQLNSPDISISYASVCAQLFSQVSKKPLYWPDSIIDDVILAAGISFE